MSMKAVSLQEPVVRVKFHEGDMKLGLKKQPRMCICTYVIERLNTLHLLSMRLHDWLWVG